MKHHIWMQRLLAGMLVGLLVSACSATATPTVLPTPVVVTIEVTEVPEAVLEDLMTVDAEGNTSVSTDDLDAALAPLPATGLTETEAASLRYMHEEEKLAHDVYITLFEAWGLPIFQNIANSESTHTEAVLTLLERYEVADPVGDNGVGVFIDPTLQALYDQLVARGSVSLSEALKVGTAIEEIDILDLEEGSAQTNKEDILLVYANLTKGSRNHLRSFVRTLQQQTGETYAPEYMSQDAYDAIIGGDIERGNGGAQAPSGRRGGGRGNVRVRP